MIKTLIVACTFLFICFSALCSFNSALGGEGFEITINSKVVVRKFGPDMAKVSEIILQHPDDEISIRYFHCGSAGKARNIRVINDHNKLVWQWQFIDSEKHDDPMKCRAGNILNLRKSKQESLKIYYSSSELPTPRLLVIVR